MNVCVCVCAAVNVYMQDECVLSLTVQWNTINSAG